MSFDIAEKITSPLREWDQYQLQGADRLLRNGDAPHGVLGDILDLKRASAGKRERALPLGTIQWKAWRRESTVAARATAGGPACSARMA